MSGGIDSLSKSSKSVPVWVILLGCTALFFIMLLVTTIVFNRLVTSELFIIHAWTALELCVIAMLYGTGRFGVGSTVTLTSLVGTATIASLVCYVLYYRLDEAASYWIGMIPLILAGFVVTAILGFLAFSKAN
jgi:hypothetical protein